MPPRCRFHSVCPHSASAKEVTRLPCIDSCRFAPLPLLTSLDRPKTTGDNLGSITGALLCSFFVKGGK